MAGRFGNVGATFLGGVDRGQRAAENKQAQQDARRKMHQENAINAFKLSRDVANQTMEAARNKLGGITPEATRIVEEMKTTGVGALESLSQYGIPSPIPLETARAAFDSQLEQPTAEDTIAVEAKRQGELTTATEEAKAPFETPKAPQVQNFLLPDGERQAVDMTAPGARDSVQDLLKRGAVRVGLNVSAESIDSISPKDTSLLRESEITTRNVLNETARIREQIQGGSFTGLTGGVIQGLNSVAGTMAQASRAISGVDETELLNPANYDFRVFGPEAERSAALRSNVTNLAYTLARAAEPGGRLSERDVQLQFDRLRASAGDPNQLLAALGEVDRSVKTALKTRFEVYGRGTDIQPPPDLFDEGGSALLDQLLSKPVDQITEAEFSQLTEEEQDLLLQQRRDELVGAK